MTVYLICTDPSYMVHFMGILTRQVIKTVKGITCLNVFISLEVKSLGVILDSSLSFRSYVKIAGIRLALSKHHTEALVNSLISCRIDDCIANLAGYPKNHLSRLQIIPNSASLSSTRYSFSFIARIEFHTLLFTFKALHNLVPSYVCDLLYPYSPYRSLHSPTALLLNVPLIQSCFLPYVDYADA